MKALIVYSGGLDSSVLLHKYKDVIALALSFDYGSKHAERELAAAAAQCALLGIKHEVVRLPFVEQLFKSALLKGGEAIPTADYDTDNMKSTVVPFRNGIMLAIAAGVAESNGLDTLLIANHAGDHAIYPDCTEQFIDAMGAAIDAGTYETLRLFAPFCNHTKRAIALEGRDLGVDYALTYSCYNGTEQHCGICATCRERKQALEGFDPTHYAQ